ncbi:DUF4181 domain-containing protein [Solibacillus isronensis]|uniref:DUF4181 domain-containing protein n=1 Tax=Solibacillus isronensis TaxID=412383 RepID=UPI0039A1E532
MLIVVVIIAFFGAGLLDLNLRKKYNIPKNEKFMDQYVGIWHFVLEVLLCLMFLSYVTINQFDEKTLYSVLFAFIMILFIIRGLLEFLFRKEKRRHIISFTYVVLCAICSIAIAIIM